MDVKGTNNNYIDHVRIVQEGDYYLEVFIDRAITAWGMLYQYELEGYLDGFTLNINQARSYAGKVLVKGNVGIGTDLSSNANSYSLAINGKIGAKEVQVENTSTTWPDYVFADDYDLKPLSEVENFIRENRHLPDIPSAQEMAKKGQNLGEMNALLLQKIEELMLYVIEQENSIRNLEKPYRTTKGIY